MLDLHLVLLRFSITLQIKIIYGIVMRFIEMKLLLEKEKNSNLLEDKINSLLRERELHNAEIINLKQELAKYQNNL